MTTTTMTSSDPRKFLEAVAEVLLAIPDPLPELVAAGNLLKKQRHEISQNVSQRIEGDAKAGSRFFDSVRCLKSISSGYLGEGEEKFGGWKDAGSESDGAGGGGGRAGGKQEGRGDVAGAGEGDGKRGAAVKNLLSSLMSEKDELTDDQLNRHVDMALCGWSSADTQSPSSRGKSSPELEGTTSPDSSEKTGKKTTGVDGDTGPNMLSEDELESASSATAGSPQKSRTNNSGMQVTPPALLQTTSHSGREAPTFGGETGTAGASSSSTNQGGQGGDQDDLSGSRNSGPAQSSIAPTALLPRGSNRDGSTTDPSAAPIYLPCTSYIQRKRPDTNHSYATPEDEYHDDDDPGYRIREVTEEELLAELEMNGPMFPEGVIDDFIPPPSTKPQLTERPVDPNARKVPWSDYVNTGGRRKGKGASLVPNVKYVTEEKDSFYPVEMNQQIYDCFHLRVVYERDRTGFEESKEFVIRMGEIIAARYQVVEYLGSAAFSRAIQCLDLDTNTMVCLKIIKNDKDFLDQSLDEIKLLRFINLNCKDVDEEHVLRLYDSFYHKEHLILVTELLKDNLYEFSKYNRESGEDSYFNKTRLQILSRAVLKALKYIHSLNLMHCDLKPENILMKSYSRTEVKVIDFGSSCFVDDHLSNYVQSRSYRAPEVILGAPYDEKIDIWSLGCILAELYTGYVLFQNDSTQSLLARVLGIVGPLPYYVMSSGKMVQDYFTSDGQLYLQMPAGQQAGDGKTRLHLLVPKATTLGKRLNLPDDDILVDFIRSMLELDPRKRPSAEDLLKHPFLAETTIFEEAPDSSSLRPALRQISEIYGIPRMPPSESSYQGSQRGHASGHSGQSHSQYQGSQYDSQSQRGHSQYSQHSQHSGTSGLQSAHTAQSGMGGYPEDGHEHGGHQEGMNEDEARMLPSEENMENMEQMIEEGDELDIINATEGTAGSYMNGQSPADNEHGMDEIGDEELMGAS